MTKVDHITTGELKKRSDKHIHIQVRAMQSTFIIVVVIGIQLIRRLPFIVVSYFTNCFCSYSTIEVVVRLLLCCYFSYLVNA